MMKTVNIYPVRFMKLMFTISRNKKANFRHFNYRRRYPIIIVRGHLVPGTFKGSVTHFIRCILLSFNSNLCL